MKSNTRQNTRTRVSSVDAFERAEANLHNFMMKHREVFEEYEHLVNEYNTALEAAEVEVRSAGIEAGPFKIHNTYYDVDVNKLYDELGEQDFLRCGGVIETRQALSIDKNKFLRLADAGVIPPEVVDVCREKKIKYKSVPKINIP